MKTHKTVKSIYLAVLIIIGLLLNAGLVAKPVWAAGQILKVATIEKIGNDFMLDTLQWDKDRLELKVVYEGKQILVPRGNVTFDCKLPGGKRRIGRVHFLCLIKMAGHIKKRLRLYADVKVAYDVYRPIRSLKMGHVIQPGDIELTRLKSDHVLRNIISDETDIMGHRLIRNLEEGETILAYMIQKVPLVKNGDRILIVAQKGSLRVTAPGVVRQNGFKNDTVRVENIHSRKIILGTVIDSRTVQINF
ncbi:MAG: flagellar basal body P-ring formation chaperone FlgA [Calditrichia bacterium]